jgi:YVTN family beta-propeller protein
VLDVDARGSVASSTNIVVGGDPMGVVLSSDEKKLYVANRPGNALVVIDTAKRRVQRRVKLPGAPGRVRLVPGRGQLVVTLIESGDVALLDALTLELIRRVHVGDRPEGMVFDPEARHVWVSVQGDDKVVKLGLPKLNQVQVFSTGSRPDPMLLVPGKRFFGHEAKSARGPRDALR